MKRVCILFLVAGLATWTISSCGGKKEEEKTEDSDDFEGYDLAEEKELSADEKVAEGKKLADASDCKTCHHATNRIVGPSHTEVAKKYEFTQANVTYLAGKIIQGGQGVWGEIPMTAHPDVSQSDAEKMAMYVLSLDGEKPQEE